MRKNRVKKLKEKSVIYKDIVTNHIFQKYTYGSGLKEVVRRIKLHSGVIEKLIYISNNYDEIYLSAPQRRQYRRWCEKMGIKPDLPDARSGEESYGYADVESIEGTLDYISDRFNCELRLRWMLDLIKHYEE